MPTMSAIQGEIATVLEAFDSEHFEETGAMLPEALAYLDELAEAETNKVEGYLRVESYVQGEIDWLKAESSRLSSKAKALESGLRWSKGYILQIMQAHGLKKLQGRSGSITRQSSPVSLLIGQDLPESWKKEVVTVDIQPDKDRIRAALESGQEVPGAILHSGEHVRFNRSRAK